MRKSIEKISQIADGHLEKGNEPSSEQRARYDVKLIHTIQREATNFSRVQELALNSNTYFSFKAGRNPH